MPNVREIPAQRVPFLDLKTGLVEREWYLYLLGLRTANNTYTPTLTNGSNVAASTPGLSNWSQVGNIVTVTGLLYIDPVAASTNTSLGISLPVPSNLVVLSNLTGVGSAVDTVSESWSVLADIVNKRATLSGFAVNDANHIVTYSFTYSVQ